jgi:hypothetical protein
VANVTQSWSDRVEIQASWRTAVEETLSEHLPIEQDLRDTVIFEVEQQMHNLVQRATIRVRLSPRSLRGFLQDGRWRTIFEIDPARIAGGHHPDSRSARALFESRVFNYVEDFSDDQQISVPRPSYGYIYDEEEVEPPTFLSHWSVVAHLDAATCRSISVTFGDSLLATRGGTEPQMCPSWLKRDNVDCDLEWVAAPFCFGQDVREVASLADLWVDEVPGQPGTQSYAEAQLHFELLPSMIAFVEFVEYEDGYDYEPLFQVLRDHEIGWFLPGAGNAGSDPSPPIA